MSDAPQATPTEVAPAIEGIAAPTITQVATPVKRNPVMGALHWIRYHLLDFLNPVSHIKRGKADLKLTLQALKNWNFAAIQHDEGALSTAFRGKLFCTFFLTGPLGFLAPVIGTYAQFGLTKDPIIAPYVGIVATIAAANIIGTFGFQIAWYFCNRDLYRHLGFFHKIGRVYRDLIPMQIKVMKVALTISAIMIVFNGLIAGLIQLMSKSAAQHTPMGVVVIILDVILVNAPFIRAMSAIFEQHSHVLASFYVTPAAE